MPTWKKILMVLLFAIAGIVVAFIGIKEHGESTDSTKKGRIFDQYLSIQKSEENENNDNNTSVSNEIKTDTFDNEESEEIFEDVKVEGTNEEKAIALAKNKFRSKTKNVTFNIAKKDGNIYYVSVNDNRTTEVLAWYKIDIDSGEVSDF